MAGGLVYACQRNRCGSTARPSMVEVTVGRTSDLLAEVVAAGPDEQPAASATAVASPSQLSGRRPPVRCFIFPSWVRGRRCRRPWGEAAEGRLTASCKNLAAALA